MLIKPHCDCMKMHEYSLERDSEFRKFLLNHMETITYKRFKREKSHTWHFPSTLYDNLNDIRYFCENVPMLPPNQKKEGEEKKNRDKRKSDAELGCIDNCVVYVCEFCSICSSVICLLLFPLFFCSFMIYMHYSHSMSIHFHFTLSF